MPSFVPRRPVAAAAVAAVALAGLALAPVSVADETTARGAARASLTGGTPVAREPGFVDIRPSGTTLTAQRSTTGFGGRALVDLDVSTGTPRFVARLDGHLTAASTKAPRDVVWDYLRANLAAFGLTSSDLTSFQLRRTYVDVAGTTHLDWTQSFGGVTVFGHGLQAAVTDRGRLLAIGGSPVPRASVGKPSGSRLGTAEKAIRVARRAQGEKAAPGPRDLAEQVLFVAGGRTFLGWQAITMSTTHPTLTVVDAASAGVLYRRPLAQDERNREGVGERRAPGARGLAFRYFPGAARGGKQLPVNFTTRGWLADTATTLDGNNAHAFSDVDDDDAPQPSEEVKPSDGAAWDHVLRPFRLGWASSFCDTYPCTWNPTKPYSWRKNRKQSTTQAFYFVNTFHDHLLAAPIGFTEAAGNFQLVNATGQGLGGDAVLTHTVNGADGGQGLPDGRHIDTADMATPPDGQAPRLQLPLRHQPGTTYPAGDPFSPTNAADAADTVFHEYTHGLSNRLVVDASGISTLGAGQAGAMGEGWSDWYAMDYLVGAKLQPDLPGVADVRLFQYAGEAAGIERTAPLDCAKRSTCGYTYADYGDVLGVPEVHGDGEIWAQTLWDLRTEVGPEVARSLVTRAMELAPGNPSFLDMRNAMLLADTAVFGGAHRTALWSVFATRGMGFFAGSLGADDDAPSHDGRTPPARLRKAPLTGTVTDRDTGLPVAGVRVTLAFQGGAGMVNPSTVTGSDGSWSLGSLPRGRYRKLVAQAPGYDSARRQVKVRKRGAVADLTVRRNWAAAAGGATVSSFTGPDHSPGCGPAGAIDGSQRTGWGSTAGDDLGTPTATIVPKQVTIDLGRTVDITAFGIDPAATCGDGGSASLAGFRLETSPDDVTYTPAAEGVLAAEDRGRVNTVTPTAGATGVRYVRLWMDSNQTPDRATVCPDGPYSGCSFMDLSELTVYGVPRP